MGSEFNDRLHHSKEVTIGHITATVRREREINAYAQLHFCFLKVAGPNSWVGVGIKESDLPISISPVYTISYKACPETYS